MQSARSCPCCGHVGIILSHSILSPFIAEIIHRAEATVGQLAECTICQHRYFTTRLSATECALLYRDYRGLSYKMTRQKYEPWYSNAVNDGIGSDPFEIKSRKDFLSGYLAQNCTKPLASVLDWGGDRGQFIPDSFPERFVYEISNSATLPGVARISDEQCILKKSFDLVMTCHVLEHCDDPAAIIKSIARINAKYFYFEVPLERFMPPPLGSTPLHRAMSSIYAKFRPLWIFSDFVATICRIKMGFIPPLFPVKQHEHINFFSSSSLTKVIEAAGLTVDHCSNYRIHSKSGLSSALVCIARK